MSYTIDNFTMCEGEMPVILCADETACNFNEGPICEYPAEGVDCDGNCDDGGLLVTCDGGAWQGEVAWTITDCSGNVVAEGGAPFSGCFDIPDSYTVTMTDSFGDGWNGNVLTIGDATFTIETGTEGSGSVGDCSVVAGCTDASACNYNSDATDDDGSCTFADACNSCDGPIDTDGDGVADCDEVVGCQDMMACNYDPNATDAGTCEFAGPIYDCDGFTCLVDSDGDGVCDQNEVSGCTDSSASNYSNVATDDDGSCIYPVFGCTDPSAGNFDQDADTDDGSCDYGPWDVSSTDCSMTVLLPADLDISVEGEPLSGEIWIGVMNSNGDIVGSQSYTTGEVNSIAVWGAEGDIPGMSDGETLNWVVAFDNEDGYINAAVAYDFGADTYSCNGLAGLSSLAATSVVTQMIELTTGWNIWSTYVDPENADMEAMFSGIVDNVVICKDENGAVYWPEFGLNNIGDIVDASGYQAKLSATSMLEVTGQMLDPNMSFNIEEGWGIIGYVKPDPSDAVDMMAPVVDDLVIMKDENGAVYWPEFGLNNIGNMQAGEGYQVKMMQDAMFAYTSGSGRLGYTESIRTIHYDAPQNTGSNMTIGLPLTSWEVMPAIGDEVAAYDESGRLIGSTSFTGENIALTVWGDDLTTTAKDGLAIGEKVTFKLWNSDMNTESTLVVTKWDAGSDAYTIDGISIASNIIVSGATSADAYKLYQNVPNPFNGTTTVKFYVPESTEVTIGVYNMLGEYVAEVTSDIFSVGKHEVTFDANDLGQGTYFVRMSTDNFTATKNMNIVK